MEGFRRPRTAALGGDAAGVVEAVGKEVTHVAPGDEVYGVRTGAFAEYVSGRRFVAKPSNLSFEQAAAVPVAALTALQAVRDKGRIQPGQRVLIIGAGGGVGTFCVQLAKAFGGLVTAVTSTEKMDLMRAIGAEHVLDYTREDFTKRPERYDLIIDVAGKPSLRACRRALAPNGTLVMVGAGHGTGGPLARMVAAVVRSRLLRQRVVMFMAKVNNPDLVTLRELIEAGTVTPVIDRTYPLAETPAALRYVQTEKATGKVVLAVSDA
jgi:NADPH:quinone reductase-like Zn-dependent oxidoreductase